MPSRKPVQAVEIQEGKVTIRPSGNNQTWAAASRENSSK